MTKNNSWLRVDVPRYLNPQFLTESSANKHCTGSTSGDRQHAHRVGDLCTSMRSCYSTQQINVRTWRMASRVSDSQGWVTTPPLRETFSYLRFHLRSLFWVNCQDMLVVADGVQTVLVLSTNVTLQSLQDAVRLQDWRRARVQIHWIQIKFTAEIQHFGCEPALLLDRLITCTKLLDIFFLN